MGKSLYTCFFALLLFYGAGLWGQQYRQYRPITLDFEIEATSETASVNPFMDYRLQVEFSSEDAKFSIPGFYAADGNAAESSADKGGTWRVMFTPNKPGIWKYVVSFKKGKDIAIDDDFYVGQKVEPHDGIKGAVEVLPAAKNAGFFGSRGRLQYMKSRYLHTEDGQPLLKFGANSPENFLAYKDIDSTYNYELEKNYIKTWEPHINDWKPGDPTWQDDKGKGILGALNYLASKGMNSVYALTLNIEGDARDVWPFLSHHRRDFKRYDVSKLAQWDIIFSHAEKLGIIMHLVTQEKENELILDNGETEDGRKLYYRELIARFGYHQNIIWNMGEENGAAPWWPQGQNDQQRFSMIRFLKDTDPYKNPIVIHTLPEEEQRAPILGPLLGFDRLDGISMQISDITDIHRDIKNWMALSEKANRKWIVSMDEIGPWHTGTPNDAHNTRLDSLRTEVLWSTLTAGGAGVEWYFGWLKPPHDLNAEDWRSREMIWEQSAIAKAFFEGLPYTEMISLDEKLKENSNFCFGKEGDTYVIYLKNGGTETLDLSGQQGNYEVLWYDPRKGGIFQKGSVSRLEGGLPSSVGRPPSQENADWAILVRRKE